MLIRLLSSPSCSLLASTQGCLPSSEQLLPERVAAFHLHLPGTRAQHGDMGPTSPHRLFSPHRAGSHRGRQGREWGSPVTHAARHRPLSADSTVGTAPCPPACHQEPRNASGLGWKWQLRGHEAECILSLGETWEEFVLFLF